MGPEVGREKRYAQCHFVDISAIERFMLRQVGCIFSNFVKATSIGANIEHGVFIENMHRFRLKHDLGTFDRPRP